MQTQRRLKDFFHQGQISFLGGGRIIFIECRKFSVPYSKKCSAPGASHTRRGVESYYSQSETSLGVCPPCELFSSGAETNYFKFLQGHVYRGAYAPLISFIRGMFKGEHMPPLISFIRGICLLCPTAPHNSEGIN